MSSYARIAVGVAFGFCSLLPAAGVSAAPLPDDWIQQLDRGLRPGYRADGAVVNRGRAQAKQFCAACHVETAPQDLPRRGWVEVFRKLLPMFSAYRMVTGGPNIAASTLDATRAGLAQPPKSLHGLRIAKADLDAIVEYYFTEAPDTSLPLPKRQAVTPLSGFRLASSPTLSPAARDTQYTVASIDAERHRMLLGDDKRLDVFDAKRRLIVSLPLPGVPTGIAYRSDGVYVTIIGPTYYPSDDALGMVVKFGHDAFEPAPRPAPPQVVLSGLRRPVHTGFADLDRDGTDELIVEEFGMTLGGLVSYRRKKSDGAYAATTLFDGGGFLGSAVADVNADGWPDVFALMSQYDEGLYLLLNREGKGFATKRLVREAPTFGYNSMTLADVNGDGLPDVIAANGDSTSLTSMYLKKYQGIRIYTADKRGAFRETYFYPLPGALIVKAADADGDGDVDLAATAFFAGDDGRLTDTAVFLENQGPKGFAPHSIPGAEKTVCTDVAFGDLEGDGDVDLLVSAAYPDLMKPLFTKSFGKAPYRYLYLENGKSRR